jgi:hypothetical protein
LKGNKPVNGLVPHTLLRETMWARITARTVEVFHHGQRVAAHVRSSSDRKHTTVRDHMPSSHQRSTHHASRASPHCVVHVAEIRQDLRRFSGARGGSMQHGCNTGLQQPSKIVGTSGMASLGQSQPGG